MDINSSSPAKTHRHLLYSTHLPPPPTAATNFNFNLNLHHHHHRHEEDEYEEEEEEEEKEPMFEKPLTPSDVGKLNRLVIPKQHAEKYFPLAGGDPAAEKGLLLSFEDESGKPWLFRYSYWNSSQSYVLTKGWSRFVKEKRLDAGDVVLFERHRVDAGRLFIGWRRRAAAAVTAAVKDTMAAAVPVCGGGGGGNVDYSGGWTRVFYDTQSYPPPHPCYNAQSYPPLLISSLPYQPDRIHADPGGGGGRNGGERAASNGKRVRLFGVNLELESTTSTAAPDQETSTTTTTVSVSVSEPAEPPTPDGSSTSSSQLHLLHHHQDHHQHNTPYLSHHQYSHHPHPNLEMMDMMSRDMETEMIKKGQHQYPYPNQQHQY